MLAGLDVETLKKNPETGEWEGVLDASGTNFTLACLVKESGGHKTWYEQKAVAILLTLLHLGIKDIRLGPSLPAFITPNVLGVLVKNFNIMPISTPEEDMKAILG